MQVKELSGLSWFQLNLTADANIHQSLREFLVKQNLSHAYVLSCVGSCTKINLVYPKTREIPPVLGKVELNGLYEINGIVGDVKRVEDEIRVHLHGSFTREGKEVFGGAIREDTLVFKMLEMVLAGC